MEESLRLKLGDNCGPFQLECVFKKRETAQWKEEVQIGATWLGFGIIPVCFTQSKTSALLLEIMLGFIKKRWNLHLNACTKIMQRLHLGISFISCCKSKEPIFYLRTDGRSVVCLLIYLCISLCIDLIISWKIRVLNYWVVSRCFELNYAEANLPWLLCSKVRASLHFQLCEDV